MKVSDEELKSMGFKKYKDFWSKSILPSKSVGESLFHIEYEPGDDYVVLATDSFNIKRIESKVMLKRIIKLFDIIDEQT